MPSPSNSSIRFRASAAIASNNVRAPTSAVAKAQIVLASHRGLKSQIHLGASTAIALKSDGAAMPDFANIQTVMAIDSKSPQSECDEEETLDETHLRKAPSGDGDVLRVEVPKPSSAHLGQGTDSSIRSNPAPSQVANTMYHCRQVSSFEAVTLSLKQRQNRPKSHSGDLLPPVSSQRSRWFDRSHRKRRLPSSSREAQWHMALPRKGGLRAS